MEATDNAFSKLVKLVKSWFPWRTYCRVYYECDSKLSVVNRRHHCRLCESVFCARWTANSIPFPYKVLRKRRDDGERIRACNYCFKLWEQDTTAEEYVCRVSTLYLGASCSGMSMIQQFGQSEGCYDTIEFDGHGHRYRSAMVHGTEENENQRESVEKMSDEARSDYISQSDTRSTINCMETTDPEPVDFKNNVLLWLPPEPDYSENDSEAGFSDEDDAFVSEESQCRDGAHKEHTKAMEHGVDGHLRVLISQLHVGNIPVDNKNGIESWLEVIIRLSLEAATFLKPDTNKGDAMDPGRYLKVKCIAGPFLFKVLELSEDHVRCYTHHQGSLTIYVNKLPDFPLSGEKDGKIWMRRGCLRCPRVVMSDAAWGLSFGKFLELSFSNHAAANRMVSCFQYATTDVHSVHLPPPKLDFNCEPLEWLQKEANEPHAQLFSEVLKILWRTRGEKTTPASVFDNVEPLDLRQLIADFEGYLKKEKAEFEERKGKPLIDILEVNKLRRQLLYQCYVWDKRLMHAVNLLNSYYDEFDGKRKGRRNEEKLGSTEKAVYPNVAPKPERSFRSLDSFLQATIPEGHHVVNRNFDRNQGTGGANHIDGMRTCDPSGPLVSRGIVRWLEKGPLVSHRGLRRVLSDGQFPVLANVSDRLNAICGEKGPATFEIIASDFSNVCETALGAVAESSSEDNSDGSTPLPRPPLPATTGGGDVVEMSLHQSFSKGSGGIGSRFDPSDGYNPADGARLLLPIGVNDLVIPVYDDEPTSIISYGLFSTDYHFQMCAEGEKTRNNGESSILPPFHDPGSVNSFHGVSSESLRKVNSVEEGILSMSGRGKAFGPTSGFKSSARQNFLLRYPLGKVKDTVTYYYARWFDELRRICCLSELDFIRSICRCKKCGAQGGKGSVFFAKSIRVFRQFAPEYVKYLSGSISTGCPTHHLSVDPLSFFFRFRWSSPCVVQVGWKNLKASKEWKMEVLMMENLMFGRSIERLYDPKGSSRSRHNADSSGEYNVLLGQNLIESMPTSPIFVENRAKRLPERAVWNDTSFLVSIEVMDYSLLVVVDGGRGELVLGIIDFMQQYTWDKNLETWVKASGILGGPKNASPTVVSPVQYKKRFRKAMATYFVRVPEPPSASSPPPPTMTTT
ncbi:unnamed protein product [Spirodela intermedia]|uniref:Uncharacterized protein n=1 Tax=Spirodela intermedia TaxID=51605 RepID=A0A7I8KUL2_SPIIN|nr:unnamed protein product [Spirodela intermedia]